MSRILALIPARGGSKGIPDKNIRELAGLPLIAHSIRCAKMCPQVDRVIVSTDDPEIRRIALEHGGEVPFLRPSELASDETPMWPVVQHALSEIAGGGESYDAVLLLMPTNPVRDPEDLTRSVEILMGDPAADGVVSVSVPPFNPRWVCVVEEDGFMRDAFDGAGGHGRRQELPTTYRINGVIYLWRTEFIRTTTNWRSGKIRMMEIPDEQALDIDRLDELVRTERLIASGDIQLPWLGSE